ncbi:recombinase XerD [Motilibacter peucedani]|uniref:recombinase XerD n=1 Tax=Motilibacter peucedani TaxID=598650 RepID=UPI0015FFFBA2|nr:recombinase XerD [Motilibacter peucedani]
MPGLDAEGRRLCVECAGITTPLRCTRCGTEEELYRKGACARCALRDDLAALLPPTSPTGARLADALAAAARPQSTIIWLRNPAVRDLLARIGALTEPLTSELLDGLGDGRHVQHLRGVLEHHQLLGRRDPDLAAFERWLQRRLDSVDDARHRQLLQQFATWHHLRRIRPAADAGRDVHGGVHTAKQEITQAGNLLAWLEASGQTLATCPQTNLDRWLADGTTTRYTARTFVVWAAGRGLTNLTIPHRAARSTRSLGQEQRVAWIRILLTDEVETTDYRLAGLLLLLYAQPLTKIAALRVADVVDRDSELRLRLGSDLAPVPEPFADLLRQHLAARPNLRHGPETPWLFPSTTPGRHLSANGIMERVRDLGINLLGARNAALRDFVTQAPAPVVAAMLGYSNQVTAHHASLAGTNMGAYASTVAGRPRSAVTLSR